MVNGRSTSRITSERDFMYAFDKLNKAVEQCDSSTPEWVMASIRSNEKALCNKEITDNTYMDQQQKVSGLVSGFAYNCACSKKTQAQML